MKKGQATIFIIAGLVILFVAFFIGYLQSENFRNKIESGLFKSRTVPEQAQGVISYINSCIDSILNDGVELISYQGGYIYIPDEIRINPRRYLQTDLLHRIPYWLYGKDGIKVPSIKEMEEQLERYVDERFTEDCEFTDFLDYEFDNKNIESDVSINEDSITMTLDSSMNVVIKEDLFSLQDYVVVEKRSNLKFLYDAAVDIINREIDNSPVEFVTMNLISTYASDRSIPPVAGFEFSCNPKTWIIDEVAANLRNYLGDRLRYIQIENTNLDELNAYYRNLLIDKVFFSRKDIDIDFEYLTDWPLLVEIYPNDGRLLKPNTLKFGIPFLPLLCLNTYDFRYSLQFPLMTLIEKDGEIFRFPFEVYILDNYGARQISGQIEDFDYEEGKESNFCNTGQRLSNEVKITTQDLTTGNELEDVQVNYQCGLFNCLLGETKIKNFEAVLDEKFPLCVNGKIRLNKEGYAEFVHEISTLDESRQTIFAQMKPMIEKDIIVRVVDVEGNTRDLLDNEEVSVQFNMIDKQFGGFKDQRAAVLDGKENKIQKIELVPEEEYEITANLILNQKISLDGGIVQGQEIGKQEVENAFLGGAKFTQYITDGELKNNKIIIYIVSEGIPKNVLQYFDASDANILAEKYGDLMRIGYE